jgi:hypothetical protein
MQIGDACPDFSLPGTDGHAHGLHDFDASKLFCVIVSCNHCPYVVAYEPRVVTLTKEYAQKGVGFIAVNGNDATRYPDDAMEPMTHRAKERGFPFPYVRDDSQDFVRALGARFTPEVYVFGPLEGGGTGNGGGTRRLRYHGRIDDNHRDIARVTSPDLRNALDAILDGKAPPTPETTAFGCSIKWK